MLKVDLQVFPDLECDALASGNILELRSGQTAFGRRKNRLKAAKSRTQNKYIKP